MVPGFLEYRRHMRTRVHMNEPSMILLIDADVIDDVNRTINLREKKTILIKSFLP